MLFVCSYYELLLLKNNISCVMRSTCTMEGAAGVNVGLEDQHWDCARHFDNENSMPASTAWINGIRRILFAGDCTPNMPISARHDPVRRFIARLLIDNDQLKGRAYPAETVARFCGKFIDGDEDVLDKLVVDSFNGAGLGWIDFEIGGCGGLLLSNKFKIKPERTRTGYAIGCCD